MSSFGNLGVEIAFFRNQTVSVTYGAMKKDFSASLISGIKALQGARELLCYANRRQVRSAIPRGQTSVVMNQLTERRVI